MNLPAVEMLVLLQRVGEAISHRKIVVFEYLNYRGETAERHAILTNLTYDTCTWHAERDWLADGIDVDKDQARTFLVKNMKFKE